MSVVVVSDTTALNYLILIGAVEVLPKLFDVIYVPGAVLSELLHPRAPREVQAFAMSPPAWLTVKVPRHVDEQLQLDPGENEAIALAEELRANYLLIDERDGRNLAKSRGLSVIGLPNVLDKAAEAGLLELPHAVEALQTTNYYMKHDLALELLRRDAERKAKRSG